MTAIEDFRQALVKNVEPGDVLIYGPTGELWLFIKSDYEQRFDGYGMGMRRVFYLIPLGTKDDGGWTKLLTIDDITMFKHTDMVRFVIDPDDILAKIRDDTLTKIRDGTGIKSRKRKSRKRKSRKYRKKYIIN